MTTVYILQCANGQYYVGSTNNLSDRLKEHQGDASALFRGARFTKAHLPVKLVFTEEYARIKDQGDRNFHTPSAHSILTYGRVPPCKA